VQTLKRWRTCKRIVAARTGTEPPPSVRSGLDDQRSGSGLRFNEYRRHLSAVGFFADRHLSARAIVFGQFIGIGALVVASVGAAAAALVISAEWTSLLGVAPLVLGLQRLWQLRSATNEREMQHELEREHAIEQGNRSQALAVASVTVANGGDNLAVYIPLFAHDLSMVPTYVATFAVMTGLWCAAGFALVKNPVAALHVRRYGHVALPLVLIGLGLWILAGAAPLFR
jgi:cadmium resistance protein CadD (predicted permease)